MSKKLKTNLDIARACGCFQCKLAVMALDPPEVEKKDG